VKGHIFQEKFLSLEGRAAAAREVGMHLKKKFQHLILSVQLLQEGPYNSDCWPYSKREAWKSRQPFRSSLA
jgi:hypothetical protein